MGTRSLFTNFLGGAWDEARVAMVIMICFHLHGMP